MLDLAIDQTIYVAALVVVVYAAHKAIEEYEIASARKSIREVFYRRQHPRHIELSDWIAQIPDEALVSPVRLAEEAMLLSYTSIGGRLKHESRARLGVRLGKEWKAYIEEERTKRRA